MVRQKETSAAGGVWAYRFSTSMDFPAVSSSILANSLPFITALGT